MTLYQLPPSLEDDIRKLKDVIEDVKANKITKDKLKAYRVPMGIYEQRKNNSYMIRVRLPGGGITPVQLTGIAVLAGKHTGTPLHFTTRQDVQIHDITIEDIVPLLEELRIIGLSAQGGGGNTVRNIAGSYDSGSNPDDIFDITPYVRALTNRLTAEKDSWSLPRKFKISFSSNSRDTGLARINDLGFIARRSETGEKGFSVYVAGGMGMKPNIGFQLFNFIPHTEVYNIAKAVKNLFDKNGNRRNKYKARLRFLYYEWGEEKFKTEFNREYTMVKEKKYPPLLLKNTEEQQSGCLGIPLENGNLALTKAIQLGNILKPYGDDILRTTPAQNLFIRNIPPGEIPTIIDEIKKVDMDITIPEFHGNTRELQKNPLEFLWNAVACAGAGTCRLGICNSRNLLEEIVKRLAESGLSLNAAADLTLKISGCPNTCGHHIIADIGLFGAAKRCHNRLLPYYNIMLGGIVSENRTAFAEQVGALPARIIPDFLIDLLSFIIKNRKPGESPGTFEPFHAFISREGNEFVKTLIHTYPPVPPIEEDETYYTDWYGEKIFSLAEKSSGECSAGLFDLIDLDLKEAQGLLEKSKTSPEPEKEIRESIHLTARALLITKGLESTGDIQSLLLFKDHFIGNHIDKKWNTLINKYITHAEINSSEAHDFYKTITELYDTMDNSLRFPDIQSHGDTKDQNGNMTTYDFRGVPCPMNFVKTKLALEAIESGETINILLDDGEPIDNVPGSVKGEGHTIIEKRKTGNYWSLVIQKG